MSRLEEIESFLMEGGDPVATAANEILQQEHMIGMLKVKIGELSSLLHCITKIAKVDDLETNEKREHATNVALG